MFLISFASASIYYQEEDRTYEIDTWIPDWLGGEGYSNVTLLDNTDQCLINCGFHLSGFNEQPTNLIDDINFINKKGNDISNSLKSINFQLGTYQELEKENYSSPIYGKEICEELNLNEINSTQSCYNEILGYDKYKTNELVWEEYKGQEVDGYWELKADAVKYINSRMDWIITFRGKELTEWAWWDNDWGFKREIKVKENSGSALSNYSTLIYVPYDSDMQADFDDLRFVDSAETTELGYWIENKTDSNFAWVWIKVPTLTASSNTSIYMYYGNSGASSNSNINQGFLFGDDFSSGSLNSSLWDSTTGSGGSISVSGGQLTITHTSGTNVFSKITSKTTYGTNTEIISKFNMGTLATGTKMKIGYSNYMDWEKRDSASRGEFGSFDTTERLVYYNDGGTTSYSDTISFSATSSLIRKIQRLSNSKLEFVNNGISLINKTTGIPLNSYPLEIQVQKWSSPTATINVDWVLIRNFASSEPTYTIGAEESNSGLSLSGITPANNTMSTNSQNYFNMTVTPNNVEISNTSLYILDTNYTYYNQTKNYSQNTTLQESYLVNLTDGNYTWYMEACSIDLVNCTNTGIYNLRVDTHPPEINITNPIGSLGNIKLPHNETLEYNIADLNSLTSCKLEYNKTNYTLDCYQNEYNFTYINGINNLSVYGTDEFGLTTKVSSSWNYSAIEGNTTYDAQVIEGTLNDYSVQLTLRNDLIINNASFYYNGTMYEASINNMGQTYTISKNNLLIQNVDANTNVSFYFMATLSNLDIINTTIYNQTILSTTLDDCSTNTFKILNLYLHNEEDYGNLTGTIDVIVNVYSSQKSSQIIQYIDEFIGVSSKSICSNIKLNDSNLILDAIIRYGATDYVKEFYNIQYGELNEYPKSIELYAINQSIATEFRVIYQGDNLVTVPNAVVQLLRQRFDNGQYIVTESPLTSSDSIALVHVDTTSNLYKILIYKDGVLLDTFDNLVFKCQSEITGECDLELNTPITPANVEKIYNVLDFYYSIDSSVDNEITITFGIPSQTTKLINIQLIQTKIIGTSTVCNQTVNSAGGEITCTYDKTPDDSYLELYIYVDGELYVSKGYKSAEDFSDLYDKNNFFIIFILGLSLVGMVISSPEYTIWIGIVTIILGGALFLLQGVDFTTGLAGIIWLLGAGIILLLEISRQNDR